MLEGRWKMGGIRRVGQDSFHLYRLVGREIVTPEPLNNQEKQKEKEKTLDSYSVLPKVEPD